MKYGKGSIVFKRDIVFKNTQTKDPKGCRPAMIAIASDDITDETYYLTMTSQVHRYLLYEDQYYLLGTDVVKAINLDRPSLINLESIYKGWVNEKKVGGLTRELYKDVIRKFMEFQERHPDPLYAEMKQCL